MNKLQFIHALIERFGPGATLPRMDELPDGEWDEWGMTRYWWESDVKTIIRFHDHLGAEVIVGLVFGPPPQSEPTRPMGL